MVSLKAIQQHNSNLQSLAPNLVAVFVGGTSGIGLYTAREFARHTKSPHIYLIGRNETEASRIIPELQSLNPTSQVSFIKSDVSLLKNVDDACSQIKEKETKVNLLCTTVGVMTMNGNYDSTAEGLDRKFSLHYYARARFTHNLLPLLTAAANDPDPKANLSRVVSVLDAAVGRGTSPNFSDLALKNNYSLRNCLVHTSAMNSFIGEHFAKQYPKTAFVHAHPGFVQSNLFRDFNPLLKGVLSVASLLAKPLMTNTQESGERHLFAGTAPRYAPRELSQGVEHLARGSDEVLGSGSYCLNWKGETLAESSVAEAMRKEGATEQIWQHTKEVFDKICEGDGKY